MFFSWTFRASTPFSCSFGYLFVACFCKAWIGLIIAKDFRSPVGVPASKRLLVKQPLPEEMKRHKAQREDRARAEAAL